MLAGHVSDLLQDEWRPGLLVPGGSAAGERSTFCLALSVFFTDATLAFQLVVWPSQANPESIQLDESV